MSVNRLDFIFNKKNELHNHLVKDFNITYAEDKTLHIIDNYHVKNIADNDLGFYLDNFNNTGIRKIIFYYEVKLNNKDLKLIEDLSKEFELPYKTLLSFITIFHSNSKRSKKLFDKLESLSDDNSSILKELYSIINFVEKLGSIGIEVKLQPYESFPKNYIHGRYWVNLDPNIQKGYIVDGSLNTYPKGLIIGQLMDKENYDVISDVLNEIISKRTNDFDELGFDELTDMYKKIQKINP